MHVLFVIDPLPLLKAYKDSSVAMMRALVVKGHRLSAAMMGDMYIEQGVVKIRAAGIELIDGADSHGHAWCSQPSPAEDIWLADFDAVLMRQDPPISQKRRVGKAGVSPCKYRW